MPTKSNRFSAIAAGAREKTNAKLADELSSLTPITKDKLQAMLPEKGDKEQFARLMAVVNDATTHNEKVAAFRKNVTTFASVAIKVLKTVS